MLGLALSGGGVRGIAHIGLLKVLQEEGIEPQVISGASAGAIVGALYAAGMSCEDMLQFFRDTELFDLSKFTPWKPGLLDLEKFEPEFADFFPKDSFEELDKKLIVVASDILAGEMVTFTSGSLVKAVLASAAFPGIFTPLRMDDRILVDGGVFNNLPAELLRDECEVVIGMDVNPIVPVKEKEVDSTMEILQRVMVLMIRKQSLEARKYCDIFLSPSQLTEVSTFGQKQLDRAYEIGYNAARNKVEEIKKIAQGNSSKS